MFAVLSGRWRDNLRSPLTVPVRWVACKGGLCFNPSGWVARLTHVNRPLSAQMLEKKINFLISFSKNCIPVCQMLLRTARCSYVAIIALALHSVILIVAWECRFLCHHKENCLSHRHSVWNNNTLFQSMFEFLSSKTTASSGIYWLWGPIKI